jgi:hypothetical protein
VLHPLVNLIRWDFSPHYPITNITSMVYDRASVESINQ